MPDKSKPSVAAYRIVTPRLVIRCWNPEDVYLIDAAINESREHLRPWMSWIAKEPLSIDERLALLREIRSNFDRDIDYTYAILNLEESRVLGGTGLHRRSGAGAFEIGYWIHVHFTRQGLATEAAAALTRVAFEVHEVERMEIHMNTANQASASVPRKLGYSHEATLRKRLDYPPGGPHDEMVWSMFAADYPQSPFAELQIEAYDAVGRRLI